MEGDPGYRFVKQYGRWLGPPSMCSIWMHQCRIIKRVLIKHGCPNAQCSPYMLLTNDVVQDGCLLSDVHAGCKRHCFPSDALKRRVLYLHVDDDIRREYHAVLRHMITLRDSFTLKGPACNCPWLTVSISSLHSHACTRMHGTPRPIMIILRDCGRE